MYNSFFASDNPTYLEALEALKAWAEITIKKVDNLEELVNELKKLVENLQDNIREVTKNYLDEMYENGDLKNLLIEVCEEYFTDIQEAIDEEIEVMFVSTMEYGTSIGNTYFFISSLGTKVREIYLPIDSYSIWDKCDVLITANPKLLGSKPDGKTTIKINTEYNKESESNYAFNSLESFLNNEENTIKLINERI